MTDLLAQYGPLGAIAVMLTGVVATMVRQRVMNGRHRAWDGIERRADPPRLVLDFTGFAEQLKPLLDIRSEMKEMRAELVASRHELRGDLQPLVTKVAVLATRLEHLERHRGEA